MKHTRLSVNLFTLFTVWVGTLISLPCAAKATDFSQPITVDSATQFSDGIKKLSIFKDNVVIVQGSLRILADEVVVDASAGKGQEVLIARGAPAQFMQTLADGSQVKASANEVRYTVVDRKISLEGAAELAQNASTVSGASIVFDMLNEQLIASGTDSESGRVKAIFQTDKPATTGDKQ